MNPFIIVIIGFLGLPNFLFLWCCQVEPSLFSLLAKSAKSVKGQRQEV